MSIVYRVTATCPICGQVRQIAHGTNQDQVRRCRPCGSSTRRSRGITTYSGVHRALTMVRGYASEHWCDSCDERAAEWAYLYDEPCVEELTDPRGQKFTTDLEHYVPMCRRCHRLYDKKSVTHCPQGHPYEGDNLIMDAGKRKCKTCVYARNRARAREHRVHRQSSVQLLGSNPRNSVTLTKYAVAASVLATPLLFASPAGATEHTDPCPNSHIQVWSEVGNSGAGQATNHFVCGQVGRDGKDGKDGSDSTVPGPQGPAGPAGENGSDLAVPGPAGAAGAEGAQGPQGPAGVDGVAVDGAVGPVGPRGATGSPGSAGMDGARGLRGSRGAAGADGVTKTVYITRTIHDDGTITDDTVPSLPATGSDSDTFWLALVAVGLVGTGVVAIKRFRR